MFVLKSEKRNCKLSKHFFLANDNVVNQNFYLILRSNNEIYLIIQKKW